MSTTAHVGRNEACPCGSGRKFKVCCGVRVDAVAEPRRNRTTVIGLAVVGLAMVATLALALRDSAPSTAGAAIPPSTPLSPPPAGIAPATPKPPGPAPEGKVWSAEHGHWHDAPGTTAGAAPQLTPAPGGSLAPATPAPQPGSPPALKPQPDGPAPEGKVWSAEHGHWHDAPAPPPPGPK